MQFGIGTSFKIDLIYHATNYSCIKPSELKIWKALVPSDEHKIGQKMQKAPFSKRVIFGVQLSHENYGLFGQSKK